MENGEGEVLEVQLEQVLFVPLSLCIDLRQRDQHLAAARMHICLCTQEPAGEEYLSSRAQAVESIESTIGELGTMYKKLITIVDMHNEMTIRCEGASERTTNKKKQNKTKRSENHRNNQATKQTRNGENKKRR